MKRKPITFKLEAKKEGDVTKVYLYGDIVDEQPVNPWTGEQLKGDYIFPEKVRQLLESVETEDIELHINSYGGSVFASVAIYSYIKEMDKTITCYIDGVAASGASLIAVAGDKLIMPANTMLMVHRASGFCWGNCVDMRKVADILEEIDNSTVVESYLAKWNGSREELNELIAAETWINAKKAKELGLCDEVVELVPEDKAHDPQNIMNNFLKLKFE